MIPQWRLLCKRPGSVDWTDRGGIWFDSGCFGDSLREFEPSGAGAYTNLTGDDLAVNLKGSLYERVEYEGETLYWPGGDDC